MKEKSKSEVSIIGGADGPTSIFIAGRTRYFLCRQDRPADFRRRSGPLRPNLLHGRIQRPVSAPALRGPGRKMPAPSSPRCGGSLVHR